MGRENLVIFNGYTMPIVFAGITPHPPLLLETIGKEKARQVKKTRDALQRLEQDLYIAKPHVIVLISPHESFFADVFTINAHTNFVSSFEEFGDVLTKKEWRGAPEIAASISHQAKTIGQPLQLIAESRLGHGASVPLYFLTEHLPTVGVLPIGYCGRDRAAHVSFGMFLKECIMNQNKRFAVIASGDLSHMKSATAASAFDRRVIELLEQGDHDGLAGIDEQMLCDADECGYRSLLILLGILKDRTWRLNTYSYEAPFGVGYLVGNCNL